MGTGSAFERESVMPFPALIRVRKHMHNDMRSPRMAPNTWKRQPEIPKNSHTIKRELEIYRHRNAEIYQDAEAL